MISVTRTPALSIALMLAGCAALEEREERRPQVAVPEQWAAAGVQEAAQESVPEDPWWRDFGSPELDQWIAEALEKNRDLGQSVARLRAAGAQARIAAGGREPTVGLGLQGNRQKQIFVGLPIPGGDVLSSTFTSLGLSLDVSWEADLWGRLSAEQRSAEFELVASAADLAAARLSVAGATAKAWLAWQEARLQLELAGRSVESFERTENLVQRRFEGGVAELLDVRLAGANASNARALEASRRDAVERAKRQLEILLGRYPGGELEAPEGLPATPPPPPAGVPGTLVARRPDLSAAEARMFATEERLVAARASLYPQLTLSGSVGRTSNEIGDLIDPDFSVWSIVGSLVQPILQGGRLRAGVDLADARLEEAVAAFEARLLVALNEVESQLVAEEHLATWEQQLQRANEDARAAQEIAEDRYDAGLSDLLIVLEAQRRALEVEGQYWNVRRERLSRRVDLHLALGGGFETEEVAP